MKHYYQLQDKVYIGAKCPNCEHEFSILDKEAVFKAMSYKGEEVKILLCGTCEVDIIEVEKKLDGLNLKEMDSSELQNMEV